MLRRLHSAGLVWPTLLALAGLVVLVGLGTWQLQRKAWKEGLIARISERTHAAPASLAEALLRWGHTGDVEYLRVTASGRFRHETEQYFYALHPKYGPGYHVYTALATEAGPIVWVNRGYVPADLKDPAKRAAGQPDGTVRVVGLARAPGRPGPFTPANDPQHNLWYWRDLEGMTKAAFAAGREPPDVAPFSLDAEAEPPNPGGFPEGGTTVLELPNRHLEYAVTWFGLAGTLLAVFLAFARGRLRESRG